MNVKVTKHGKQRTKERLGLSKKLAESNAAKALEHGIKHSDVKGSLNRYFTALYQTWRNTTSFSYGDISHTLFPRKKDYRDCFRFRCMVQYFR